MGLFQRHVCTIQNIGSNPPPPAPTPVFYRLYDYRMDAMFIYAHYHFIVYVHSFDFCSFIDTVIPYSTRALALYGPRHANLVLIAYRCVQRRFRRACASAQSRQNLRCSLIQAVSQEEPSDRKPDPWPLWMAGHAQLKFVMIILITSAASCFRVTNSLTRGERSMEISSRLIYLENRQSEWLVLKMWNKFCAVKIL